jgi:H+/gluconate symporter-like permease
MAALMYSRKLSALLALPIMAVAIAAVGHIPPDRILSDVLAKGSIRLSNAYTTTIFGAILADLINKLGIAKSLVRFVAEFGGDSPFLLGLFMTFITALLFSSLGGLGAVIMVGTVVLPVLLSLGISPITAGSLFIFGISIGGMFNLANWQLYTSVLSVSRADIAAYLMPFSAVIAAIILVFLAVELGKKSNIKWLAAGLLACAGAFLLLLSGHRASQAVPGSQSAELVAADPLSVQASLAIIFALAVYAAWRRRQNDKSLPAIAFLSPAVPIVLVLAFHWEIIPAFVFAILFAVLSTWQRDSINTLTRCVIEGTASVAAAVAVMIGIGMLLAAVMDPAVANAMAPVLKVIVPTAPLPYVIIFTLAAPLALYRGPLNVWGMGSGLIALMQTATTLGARAIMSMLWSVGQVQGVSDPTNTQNVWVATYLGIDTESLLKRTLPYAWFATLSGLLLAVGLGYVKQSSF